MQKINRIFQSSFLLFVVFPMALCAHIKSSMCSKKDNVSFEISEVESTADDSANIEFKVSKQKGRQFVVKPSLAARLSGVKEVQVYQPLDLTSLDKYI